MSYIKNQPTEFSTTDQDCPYGVEWVRIDGLRKSGYPNLRIGVGLRGCIGTTEGVIEKISTSISRAEVVSELTAAERTAGKLFIAALERVAGAKIAAFDGIDHNDSDVMT